MDDCADACLYLMKEYSAAEPVNLGTGIDHSILELAALVLEAVGYRCKIEHDLAKPDGTRRKLLDVRRLADMGWRAPTGIVDGLRATYRWLLESGRLDRDKGTSA